VTLEIIALGCGLKQELLDVGAVGAFNFGNFLVVRTTFHRNSGTDKNSIGTPPGPRSESRNALFAPKKAAIAHPDCRLPGQLTRGCIWY